MSVFGLAQQPEILHGLNKDKEILAQLKERLLDLLEKLVSPQTLFRHAHWVGAVASLIYFGGNSLRLQQTLGEEYAYIRQFSDRDHVYLSHKRLLLFLCLEVFGELLVKRVATKRVDRWISKMAETQEAGQMSWRRKLACAFSRCVGDAQSLMVNASQLHLCIFYLQGFYASIPKRLAGIKYLQAVKIEQHAFSYRRVGLMMLVHLGLKLLVFAVRLRREFAQLSVAASKPAERSAEEQAEGGATMRNRKGEQVAGRCGICFEKPSHPSCLPCGHMYCWECVLRSSQFKPECPNCRKPFEPREVVCLSNVEV